MWSPGMDKLTLADDEIKVKRVYDESLINYELDKYNHLQNNVSKHNSNVNQSNKVKKKSLFKKSRF